MSNFCTGDRNFGPMVAMLFSVAISSSALAEIKDKEVFFCKATCGVPELGIWNDDVVGYGETKQSALLDLLKTCKNQPTLVSEIKTKGSKLSPSLVVYGSASREDIMKIQAAELDQIYSEQISGPRDVSSPTFSCQKFPFSKL